MKSTSEKEIVPRVKPTAGAWNGKIKMLYMHITGKSQTLEAWNPSCSAVTACRGGTLKKRRSYGKNWLRGGISFTRLLTTIQLPKPKKNLDLKHKKPKKRHPAMWSTFPSSRGDSKSKKVKLRGFRYKIHRMAETKKGPTEEVWTGEGPANLRQKKTGESPQRLTGGLQLRLSRLWKY